MSQTEFKPESQTEQKELENKMQNKKAGKIFAVITVIASLTGAVMGFFGAGMQDQYDKAEFSALLGEKLTLGLGLAMPVLMTVFMTAGFIYAVCVLRKSRRQWQDAQSLKDEEFDIWYEKTDSKLDVALSLVNFILIFNYFGFSAAFYAELYCEEMEYVLFLLALADLIITLFLSIGIQGKIVDLVKLINPEKSGSVYDVKFMDKWIDSCDELERLMIYKAGFKSYKVTSNVCVGLWMIFTVLSLMIQLSLWPVAIVSAIWMLQTATYAIECRKLSYGDGKKKGGSENI